jgi:hypothetical protein
MSLRTFVELLFPRKRPSHHVRRPTRSHLRLEALEQRTLLSVSPFSSSSTSNPPVTYEIIAPEQTNVGAKANFEVIARDGAGQQDQGYDGTASLAETGATTSSTLPTSLTFHHGEADFQASFTGTGTATFTATETDTVNTTPITGTGATTVNAATTATQLVLFMPAHETPGQPINVVVEALDASGHRVPDYTGTVTLTSPTDSSATVPSAYTFTAADAGKHTFQVTFSSGSGTGQQTITAIDNSSPQLTGSVSTNLTAPNTVTHFAVKVPDNVQVGVPTDVLVQALNANNQPVRGYTGTVSFATAGTSTTASETLPSSYTFTSGRHGDDGQHEFHVTFNSTGTQSFVATDGSGNTSPTVTTNVYAAPVATSLQIIAPEKIPEGVAVPVVVEALDAANHVVKTFSDTVTLTGGTATATGPTTPNSNVQGKLVFKVTAPTGSAGTTLTLTATDTTADLMATATVSVVRSHSHSHGHHGEHGDHDDQGDNDQGDDEHGDKDKHDNKGEHRDKGRG